MDISSSSPSWSCCSLIRNTKDTGELSKLALLPCTLHWLGISLFLFFTSILRHNICHSVSTVWSPHTKLNSNILLWNAPFSELRLMYNFFHENITAFVTNNTCAKQGEFSFLKNITHQWSYIFSYNFISSSTALLNMLVPSITSPTSNSSSNFLNFSTAALLSCWAIISLCGAPPEDDLGIVNIQLRKLKKTMKLCWLLISQIYVTPVSMKFIVKGNLIQCFYFVVSATIWWLPKTKGLKTALTGSGVPVNQCRADEEQRTEAWESILVPMSFKPVESR